MSLVRIYNRKCDGRRAPREKCRKLDSNTSMEYCEILKKYSLVDCFCIKEIAKSYADGLGLKEELLSDDLCNYIAEKCFATLVQIIDNGHQLMKHRNRRKYTIQDFQAGTTNLHHPFPTTPKYIGFRDRLWTYNPNRLYDPVLSNTPKAELYDYVIKTTYPVGKARTVKAKVK